MFSGECVCQCLDRVGLNSSDLLDPVFIPHQVGDFAVEHLPGRLLRLLENDAAIFGISVVAKICSLIEKSLSIQVDA